MATPASLTLRLFGSFTILCDQQLLEVKSHKAVAILAYLALQRRRQSRDHLAALLWPETDQARARANLRRTLWTINQTPLSAVLNVLDDSVALRTDGLWVDGIEFERLLARGPQDVSALEQAAALYDGDLLADFTLPDCGDFELWLIGEQERYRRRALETFYTLADNYLRQHNFSAAKRMARRQIAIDNLQEVAYQQLFRALAAAGQRTTALSEYATLRALLHEELNVEPSPQTVALIEQIRAGAAAINGRPPGELAAGSAPAAPAGPDRDQPPAQPAAAQQPPPCPYRGLLSFRVADAPHFFGREGFVGRLVSAVQHRPFTAVIGPSGAGKTSVIHAGLIPALRRRNDWIVVSTRPGDRPFHALATDLLAGLGQGLGETEFLLETRRLAEALESGQIALRDMLERIARQRDSAEPARVLLVIDHFSEIFAPLVDHSTRQRFIDAVLEPGQQPTVTAPPRFAVVMTLRADFLGHALAHRSLTDALRGADLMLGPMTRAELTRAVVNPAHLQQVEFEPGLAERIVRDVGSEPGSLPLLEFSLAALWERQDGSRLTHTAYDAIGGVEGALTQHAEAVFLELSPDQQVTARRIFMQLVRPGVATGDTSRRATCDDLGTDAWQLVVRLADSRILVTGRDASGLETAEISHEALIHHWNRLRGWIEEDRAFRLWQEQLRMTMRNWEAQGRDEGALLRGSTLATAQVWMVERPDEIGQAEVGYMAASVAFGMRRTEERALERQALLTTERDLAASRAQQRRLRSLVALTAAALLGTLVMWSLFLLR